MLKTQYSLSFSQIGWIALVWDLAGFGLFTLLAIVLGRRLQLDVTTPEPRTPARRRRRRKRR